MPLLEIVTTKIDRLSIFIGKAGSLALPVLIVVILANVFLRYVFNLGLVELEEVQWHLNAIVVMSCLAYSYQANEHVRADVFHNTFSPRKKAWVEILGVLFLLFPYTGLVGWHAWSIASYSWTLREGSPMPSGLPARYLIKGVMALGLSLLTLQGFAVLTRNALTLVTLSRKEN
ncbi:C4-dicarboxylate ABC transporter permease [Marinomonas primoryensis]|uniref:TRAP transporter small permease protein n=1 Tax=Marinomonas primoryensis TaxID=178399 RepID=A0A2Z4PVL4_9GAMM|nr:TRAP transporter small permease subunit [Marinomonas primoryensis]AWY01611.1 C4-dicarboxylate ABC transporter permease [Marinomonas primoryensis]